MNIVPLYKYTRPEGGVTVSPNKPDCEYVEMYRLIADAGKLLTNGVDETSCADVMSADGWYEIDAPEEDAEMSVT